MKKQIKTIAGLLALILAFSGGMIAERENISITAPITASAYEVYEAFQYAIEYSEVVIKGFDKSTRDIVIPSEIEGLPVASIGNSAFSSCDGITSVTIPDSLTSIRNSAFYNCSGLTSVTIPDSVKSIGNSVFSGCTGLTSVTISTSVTSIGVYAFENCSSLTSVTIPTSVTSIENFAFKNCRNITSITIPESVTNIDNAAFWQCSKLKSVTLLNPKCEIYNNSFTLGDKSVATIYGYANSTAQTYAEKYGYNFEVIGTAPENPTPENPQTNQKEGDINKDGKVDAVDASIISSYYAYLSTTQDNPVMSISEFQSAQQ